LRCLGFGSGSCGQDLAAAGHAVYNFVVQPFVQTAQDDWACVSRGTHCAAAALNTGLMLLPVEGLISKDIALAASEATRGALRDVGTSIGEKITDGVYRLAEETGSIDLRALSRSGEQDANALLDGAGVSDAARAADSLPTAENAKPAALGNVFPSIANPAAEGESNIVYRVLRADENPELGLVAKNPEAEYSLTAHARNGSNLETQFISATRSQALAEARAAQDGCLIACIDLNRYPGRVVDFTDPAVREAYLTNPIARNYAAASQEVVLQGPVPRSAITGVYGP
jgi:hypothetical protein